jgi:hypothetical protein
MLSREMFQQKKQYYVTRRTGKRVRGSQFPVVCGFGSPLSYWLIQFLCFLPLLGKLGENETKNTAKRGPKWQEQSH